jgi:hypothetical protein
MTSRTRVLTDARHADAARGGTGSDADSEELIKRDNKESTHG